MIKSDLTGTLNAFRCKIRQDFGNNIEVDPILDEMRTLHGSLSEVTMKAKKDQVVLTEFFPSSREKFKKYLSYQADREFW